MRIAVILPAAGLGKRFNAAAQGPAAGASKIELDLVGRPVFLRSLEAFMNRPVVGQIILAVNPDAMEDFRFRWGDKLTLLGVKVVPGGKKERWETVLNALDAVDPSCTHAAIHDAARPMASAKLIDRVFEAAKRFPAVVPGLPVASTLKRVEPVQLPEESDPLDAILGGAGKPVMHVQRVTQTVDRRQVVEVQTPQVFEIGLLRRAYAQITDGKLQPAHITDDAGLVEDLGESVYVVDGEVINFKITRPDDMELAAALLQSRQQKDAASVARKALLLDEE